MTVKAIAAGLLLAGASTLALAQGTTPPAASPPAAQPAPPPAAAPPIGAPAPSAQGIEAHIAAALKEAGYTDVSVQPGSYVAQGKKNGQTVTLLIGPDSITEVVMGAPVKAGAPASPQSQAGADMFTTVPAGEGLSSQVVGTSVMNKDGKDIGTIKDVAFMPQGGVQAYILGVGGFLGLGDHYVAVKPTAVMLTYDAGAKKWKAMIDTDADNLKKAPEYKYPS